VFSNGWSGEFGRRRREEPWDSPANKADRLFFLYEANTHVGTRGLDEKGFRDAFSAFLEKTKT